MPCLIGMSCWHNEAASEAFEVEPEDEAEAGLDPQCSRDVVVVVVG